MTVLLEAVKPVHALQERNNAQPSDPLTGYLPGFDGLRAIAIVLAIVAHAGYGHIIPGGLGVTIFFAISGFLITTLLLNEARAAGRIDIARFYMRRFLRLYPELLVFLAVTLIVGALLGLQATLTEKLAGPFYYMNYYYAFGSDYAFGTGYPWRHLWSLAVEEHFYFFFPLLVSALLLRPDRMRAAVCMLIGAPLIWRLIAYHGLAMPTDYTYVSTEARIDSIAWGCLLALLLRRRLADGKTVTGAFFLRPWLVWAALAVLICTLVYRDEDFRWTWRFSLIGAALFLLIGNLLFDPRWKAVVGALEWPPLRHIGRLAYSLYLYHLLVNQLLLLWMPITHPFFLPLSFFVCFLVAELSFRTIEAPLKPLRRKFGSHVR